MFPDYHLISGFGSVYIQFTQKQNIKHYSDSQVISQELRVLSAALIIVNACFDHRYSTAVLQTEV